MIKRIRNLNLGYFFIMLGIIAISSGLSLADPQIGEKTLLCFDQGCLYVQGFSNLIVGGLVVLLGLSMLKRKPPNRSRKSF